MTKNFFPFATSHIFLLHTCPKTLLFVHASHTDPQLSFAARDGQIESLLFYLFAICGKSWEEESDAAAVLYGPFSQDSPNRTRFLDQS